MKLFTYFRFTGKKAVQITGCALFCLFICIMAFWNRSLVIEPVTEHLRGNLSRKTMKATVHDNYLGDRLRGKSELLSLNGGFVRLEGCSHCNEVYRTTNDMLVNITTNMIDTSAFSSNLEKLCRSLESKGIPFLFVLAPCKVPTEENILPQGITDATNATADQAIAELRDKNVPFLDLRKDMSRTGEQVHRYFFRTDHHWNAEGSFRAFQLIMDAIRKQFPETRTTFTDPQLWEKTINPDWWLGSSGRRVGPLFAGTDDLDYYLPLFETEMFRCSPGVCSIKGDFRKTCIQEWFLEQSDLFNMDSYSRYLGGGYPMTLHRNPLAENRLRLTVIRDSFMLPVECFLSTELASIDVLDPRIYGIMPEADYISLNQPDMVILMIFSGTFTSDYYRFFTNFGEISDLDITAETRWEEMTVAGEAGSEDYLLLPADLEKGKSYVLTLDKIQIDEGEPNGAQLVLFHGDKPADTTIFDIDYGNQCGYHWGFQIPKGAADDEEPYELRMYAGIKGDTKGIRLTYQGIQLQECTLIRP